MAMTLFILNDAPYGTERSYNALRLAGALSKREGEEVKLFLIGDAASCAKAGSRTLRCSTPPPSPTVPRMKSPKNSPSA